MRNPKFQIYTGKDDQFYFRLRAANGEIILNSEGYTAKAGCQNGISSVQENAPNDERYRRKTATNGQYYFVLVAANGETIGRSEMYTTERGREDGIEAVKKTATDAPVEDTTAA
jgi:uncharacterized protein YegP (UPF0339 family)